MGKAGWPLAGQDEVGGQMADGVGGLGAAAVAAEGDGETAGFEDVNVGVAVVAVLSYVELTPGRPAPAERSPADAGLAGRFRALSAVGRTHLWP